MKYLLLIFIMFTISGCNSVNPKATMEITSKGLAAVHGSKVIKFGNIYGPKTQISQVNNIDDTVIEQPTFFRVHPLSPGSHKLILGGAWMEGRFGEIDTCFGSAEVEFEANAGHEYEVRGSVLNNQYSMFVFDVTTGSRASKYILIDVRETRNPI